MRSFFAYALCAPIVLLGCRDAASPSDAPPPLDASDDSAAFEAGNAIPESASDGGPFQIGPHAPFPQIPTLGGPTLTAPHLVTVTFDGYADDAQVAAFGDFLVASSWLSVVGKDYGVGTATHTHVQLGTPPTGTIADSDVQAFLAAHIADSTLPSATDDGGVSEYVYAIFYPVGVDVTLPAQARGVGVCSLGPTGAYHWESQTPHVAYDVIPTCLYEGSIETLAQIEMATSHEFIEAVTDPFPETAPAFVLSDANIPWSIGGGEVADVCEGEAAVQEDGFSVQRVWSNTAAAAEKENPCIPSPAPFFDASVSETADAASQSVPVTPGQSVSLVVQGFSSEATAPWAVRAYVVGELSAFNPQPVLGTDTIGNGESTSLKLTVPAGTASQRFATVLLESSAGAETHSWPVVVYAP